MAGQAPPSDNRPRRARPAGASDASPRASLRSSGHTGHSSRTTDSGTNKRPQRATSSPSNRRSQGMSRSVAQESKQKAPTNQAKRSTNRSTNKRSQTSRKGSFAEPSLWTKHGPQVNTESGMVRRILSAIGKVFLSALMLLGHGLGWVGHTFVSLVSRSRLALAVVAIVALLLVGGMVDLGMNWGKAYAGVHVGQVDASGKTADQIRTLVEQAYTERLSQGSATIYADEDAAAYIADTVAQAEDAALAEQRSVEEARANKQLWTTDAASLGAMLPVDELVTEALSVGREVGGLGARLGALFGGWIIEPRATYNEGELELLAVDVDATIGNPRVDFGIAITDGKASITQGHDGYMINREAFARLLDQTFLESENGKGSFVAHTEYAPLRIDSSAAQIACDQVNAALNNNVRFTYGDTSWEASSANIGDWVATRVEAVADTWQLTPFIDETRAKPAILTHVQENRSGDALHVTFENNNGDVTVHTDGSGDIPLVSQTVKTLENVLFGPDGKAQGVSTEQQVEVPVASGAAPTTTSFDEAIELGLVTTVSSFTTDFTNGAGTENRNHNIRLVSDLLSNSIVKPGEAWSFNGTAGECNSERGFLGAGAIVDGEYEDAVGGGICQVATTVFNSVYEAGYPVTTRHNHSLYIASYPVGRDAAVSWPDLDLVWKNDTASDVLVRATYTDSSVTITLYGFDPDYRVTSTVGDWAEGKKHKTKTERDESMAPGASYVKTAGTDGKSITVIRTVTSATGTVLHEDPFYSTYDPINEVVVAGPELPEKTSTETSDTKKPT